MSVLSSVRSRFSHLPQDMVWLAFVNGLSDMALSSGSLFGILAILSGAYFLRGIAGVGVYIATYGVATFLGYAGVCRYGAAVGLRVRTALYAVFCVYASGFLAAALVHPACVALSNGIGLGMFCAVFQLKSLDEVEDQARDGYVTLMGVIQQGTALIAPVLGTAMLYVGLRLGCEEPFLPPFLAFFVCALLALPVIRHIPNKPLPCSVVLPIRAIAEIRHVPAVAFFFFTVVCESMFNSLLIFSAFALRGKALDVGGFAGLIAVLAMLSLALSHKARVPGKRWRTFALSLVGIGVVFAFFDLTFRVETLLAAGAVFALLNANYSAAWFAIGMQVLEREWGHFGKNQALILSESFILAARLFNAALFLLCGAAGLSLRQDLTAMIAVFLTSSLAASALAKKLDRS